MGVNDVLIRVERTGICGTDLHIYKWDDWARRTIRVPMVIGHEFVGEVVAVGSNVSDFFPGEVVSAEGHVVCGRCRNCLAGRRHLCKDTVGIGVNRSGAFAEYIVVPEYQLFRVPASVSLERAVLTEPLACGFHATRLIGDLMGKSVAVVGPGIIGLSCVLAAKTAGASHIMVSGVGHANEAQVLKLGADLYVDTREMDAVEASRQFLGAPGFDRCIS